MSSIFHFPFSIAAASWPLRDINVICYYIGAGCLIILCLGMASLLYDAAVAFRARRTDQTLHTTDSAAFGARWPSAKTPSHESPPSHPLKRQMLTNILTKLQRH
jgi:hypothetical protein